MGVKDFNFATKASSDGVFRIVSCAYLISRKRVELFLKALIHFCQNNKTIKIEWTHIGDGPEFEKSITFQI